MRIVVRLLLVSFLAAATSLQAITYIVPTDRDLVKRAEAIVIATAVESHCEVRDGGRIVTVATLRVENVMKGRVSGDVVQLAELGGTIGGRATFIPGSPRYETGKRYLVFLRTNNFGEWMTYGFALGKFEFVSDLRGRELLIRRSADEEIFGLDESDGSLHVEQLRAAPDFVSFVQSRVASDAPAREDYFVKRSDVIFATFPEFQPKATAFVPRTMATATDYLFDCGGHPCKWSSPSASFFYCCTAQTGGTNLDGPSGISAAMAAWNSVSSASIHYTLTGSDPNPNPVPNGLSGAADGKNDILFNNPHGIVTGSAVAVGGISNATGPSGGFFNTIEVDVETGSSSNIPSFVDQALYTQLLTHELGHTLGFRHADGTASLNSPPPSCQSPSPCAAIGQAILASVIPKPNNIGSLGQWDTDAAQTVYGSGPVCTPPSISGQPSGVTITAGQSTTLSVIAAGTSPTYQWYIGTSGDTSITAPSTTSQLTISPSVTTSYWVRVSGCNTSADSRTAIVTVNQPTCTPPSAPAPTAAPSSISSGQSSTLSVSPTGTAPFTYQWFMGASGDTSSQITGATNFSTTVSPIATTSYWVKVTGQCAPASNSPATTVTVSCTPIAFGGVGAQPPTINVGQSSTISVTTSGSGPFTFQWFRGSLGDASNPIFGATGSSAVVSPVTSTAYWVHVTAPCGSQDGSVTVFVNAPCTPSSIITHPSFATIAPGGSATLTVVAAGTAPISYQWYTGTSGNTGSPILNATNASVTVSPAATTSYWVRVSNSCNPTGNNSTTAVVTVSASCPAPTISTQPVSVSAPIGTAATLTVVATAPGTTIHYQWYKGAKGDLSTKVGTDSPTFTTGTVALTASYWVRLTPACNNLSFTDSNAAIVTAVAPPRGHAVRH